MYLFFDTETSGLPKNWQAPVTDLNNWPRLVQLAYLVYDADGNRVSEGNYIIKPENFTIPKDASKIHGITNERALKEGIDLEVVLLEFQDLVNKAKFLVAHNMSFDEKVVGAEFLRKKLIVCIVRRVAPTRTLYDVEPDAQDLQALQVSSEPQQTSPTAVLIKKLCT